MPSSALFVRVDSTALDMLHAVAFSKNLPMAVLVRGVLDAYLTGTSPLAVLSWLKSGRPRDRRAR
jgi:hypothetical protein